MKKFILIILFFCSSAWSQESSTSAPAKMIPKGVNFALMARTSENYEGSIGISTPFRTQVNFLFGRVGEKQFTAGGNLEEWEYVEQGVHMKGDTIGLEIKKLFYDPFLRTSINGFFIGAAVGQVKAKFEYTYNRFKPNNAFICFGPCGKRIEETDGGNENFNWTFSRLNLGYLHELRSPRYIGVVNLFGGLLYTRWDNSQILEVRGTKHESSFAMSDLGRIGAYFGAGFTF